MTDKKDLKKRVRERQSRTQESYTQALAHVLATKDRVVELKDVTALAAELGIRCKVSAFQGVDVKPALTQMRDALLATRGDPATEALCRAVFDNEAPTRRVDGPVTQLFSFLEHVRRFFARARAGIGGVSGRMIAVHVGGTPVVGILWAMPPSRPPLFVLRSADDVELPLGSAQ
jgi:hypothetical protein